MKTFRRHPRLAALALYASVASASVGASSAWASSPAADAKVVELEGPFSDEEKALYAEYQGRTPITTRRKAEAHLETHPESIVAHYVLGAVLREAEGDLPGSMRHLGRARELYEGRWPTTSLHDDAPWRLHRELLFVIQQVAGELEQHDYRISMLEFHDELYDPDLNAERAWPLLRLGRVEEARESAQKAIAQAGSVQRSMGRNALCAIEGHAGERTKWLEACEDAYTNAKKDSDVNDAPFARPDEVTPVAVHAYNAALAARANLRPDEVERFALAGARRLEFTPANPWSMLVRLYLDQGRGQEATRALVEAERWRQRQPPQLRDQIRADKDALAATLLLVAGEVETARALVDRAVLHPDRRGLTLTTRDHTVGAHALLRMAIRRTQLAIWEEAESYGDLQLGFWAKAGRRIDESLETWKDEGQIEKTLSEGDTLHQTLALFVHGGLEPVPVWLVGDLVEIAGAGVIGAALQDLRDDPELPELAPYYDAMQVELLLADGDEHEAWQLAARVLDDLPGSEVLLKARVAALGALAADADGEDEQFAAFLETAMSLEPGVIRRMDIALPVRIHARSQDAVSDATVAMLEASPRLDAGQTGFVLEVVPDGDDRQVCMDGPSGSRLGCFGPKALVGEDGAPSDHRVDAETHARALARGFHAEAFAIPLGLSAVDMGSLDGTATVAGEEARRRLERTLDEITRE